MFDVTQPKIAWTLILVSGALEVAFSTSVQLFRGLSVYLMSLSLSVIPIGTAYAVWGGIGAVGTVLVGLLAFGETASPLRLACIGLIVLGIAGLQLVESR